MMSTEKLQILGVESEIKQQPLRDNSAYFSDELLMHCTS